MITCRCCSRIPELIFAALFAYGCGPTPAPEQAGSSSTASASSAELSGTSTTDDPTNAGMTGATSTTHGADGETASGSTSDEPTETTGSVCASQQVLVDLTPGRIMFVLERSTSMLNLWDHDYDDVDDDGIVDGGADPATPKVTRWSSVQRALSTTLANAVTPHEYGVLLFPADDAAAPPADSACDLGPVPQLGVASHPAAEVVAALPPVDANDLGGASPTRAALAAAITALGAPVPGTHRKVVYIGDGAGNCAEGAEGDARFEDADPAAIDPFKTAIAEGVKFEFMVVDRSQEPNPPIVDGEPDGVAPDDMFAEAFFLGASMTAANSELILELSQQFMLDPPPPECFIDLDHPWPIDRVEVSGQAVPASEECLGDGYWRSSEWSLFLCNAACDTFRSEGRLEVFFSACEP